MSASAEATVLITHAVGLHARPSVKFTKLAKSFAAEVEVAVAANGPWFDAKSIVKVMAAKAPKGTLLHIRAKGDVVRRDFDEDKDHARSA
jgi:phosphocarrier protein HPr